MKKIVLTNIIILSVITLGHAQSKLVQRSMLPPFFYTLYPSSYIYADGVVQNYHIFDSSNAIVCIMNINNNLEVQWEKTIYIDGINTIDMVSNYGAPTSDGQYIYQVYTSDDEFVITGIDTSGLLLFAKSYPMNLLNTTITRMAAKDGYLYMSVKNPWAGAENGVIKLDYTGNIVWQKGFDQSYVVNEIKISSDNHIFLYGYQSGAIFLMQLDENGSIIYNNTYKSSDINDLGMLYAGSPNSSHSSVVSGSFEDYSGIKTIFWAYADSMGIISTFRTYNDSIHFYEYQASSTSTDNNFWVYSRMYDNLYNGYESILFEINEAGELLTSKNLVNDTNSVLQIGFWEDHLVSNLGGVGTYLFKSPTTLNTCRSHSNFTPNLNELDDSLFQLEHNVHEVPGNMLFNNASVYLSDTSTIGLVELCYSILDIQSENAVEFNLYPNPTDEYLQLVINTPIDKIELVDIHGKNIKTIVYSSDHMVLPVGDLTPGIYFVRLISSAGLSTKKFIKL